MNIDHLPAHYSLPCGLVAGFLASAVTQPADVIKTRIQVQPEFFSTISSTIAVTIKEGGIRGLFVGLLPRTTRRTFMASFTWAFYEHVSACNNYTKCQWLSSCTDYKSVILFISLPPSLPVQ